METAPNAPIWAASGQPYTEADDPLLLKHY